MNVLLVIHTPGTLEKHIALVPSEKLKDVDLDSINNKILNENLLKDEQQDTIVNLYQRLGLERNSGVKDLKQYLNPSTPFTVDKVVMFGWSV